MRIGEPYSPCSEHGSRTGELPTVPTETVPTDPIVPTPSNVEHLSLKQVENNNPSILQPPSEPSEPEPSKQANKATEQQQGTVRESDDQATLLHCLRINHELPEGNQDRYDILIHGPNHKGPRTLLTITMEDGGSSARCPSHQKKDAQYLVYFFV